MVSEIQGVEKAVSKFGYLAAVSRKVLIRTAWALYLTLATPRTPKEDDTL